jgi:hypothetical protein
VVGERAVEITQLAAIAIAAQTPVDELARVAVSLPIYAEILVHAAIRSAVELDLPLSGQASNCAFARVRELGGEARDRQGIPGVGLYAHCADTERNPFGLYQGGAQ